MVALNATLEDRVRERTAALSQANDEIQRFAYIVSHDLRSPLVNIMGFTSELETGIASLQKYLASGQPDAALAEEARVAADDDIPEAVRFIRASTGKMDGLINAILKLSREGRRTLQPEPVDLVRLSTQAAASLKHQLDEAGATIELPADRADPDHRPAGAGAGDRQPPGQCREVPGARSAGPHRRRCRASRRARAGRR